MLSFDNFLVPSKFVWWVSYKFKNFRHLNWATLYSLIFSMSLKLFLHKINSSTVDEKTGLILKKLFQVSPVLIKIRHFKFGKIYFIELISYFSEWDEILTYFSYSTSCSNGDILLLVRESWDKHESYRPSWNTWLQSDIRLSSKDKIFRLVSTDDRWPLSPKSQILHSANEILWILSRLLILVQISSNPTN